MLAKSSERYMKSAVQTNDLEFIVVYHAVAILVVGMLQII